MGSILGHIAPVFLVIGVGSLLRALKAADERWVEVINRYALLVGFPVLIFTNLVQVERGLLRANLNVLFVNFVFLLILIGITLAVTRAVGMKQSRANTWVLCVFFGNIAYLGYPVITNALPQAEALTSFIITVYVVVLFTAGVLVLELSEGTTGLLSILGGMAKNPFVIAIAAGIAVIYTGLRLPQPVMKGLVMITGSVSPMVLLAIGIFIVRRIDLGTLLVPTMLLSMVKLAAVPACMYLFYRLAGPAAGPGRDTGLMVSVLEAAMPVAITPFALSFEYDLDRDLTASAIVVSTVVSAVTLPAAVLLLS
jgi:hypothetical protein